MTISKHMRKAARKKVGILKALDEIAKRKKKKSKRWMYEGI